MRYLVLVLPILLLGACTSTVRDLPADRSPRPEKALLAGRVEFVGTKIDSALRLRSQQGADIVVRPTSATFLVEVPPGTYEVRRFGDYKPVNERLIIQAEAGRARYIGTFEPMRDKNGALAVVIRDEPARVRLELTERYGATAPALEPGVASSSLPPLEGGDLVVQLRYVEPPAVNTHIAIGFGFGYWGGYHRHHHHRHYHRGHGHRGHGHRRARR